MDGDIFNEILKEIAGNEDSEKEIGAVTLYNDMLRFMRVGFTRKEAFKIICVILGDVP